MPTHPSSSQSDPPAGEVFGRYVLRESLGTGGMAHVFRAELPTGRGFGKAVAIKRILPVFSEDRKFVDLMLEEARVTMRLSHPNIAQTFDAGVVDGTCFIAMEFVDGPPLSQVLKRSRRAGERIPFDIALHVTMSIAAGLHCAHSLTDREGQPLHIIHRDVSPHNILLERSGGVKLIDFGVARARDRLIQTTDGAVRGKLSFFSPERAEGEGFDHRADIFALGLVLWMMLTGDHPMKNKGQVETLLAMQTWEPPPLLTLRHDLPPALGPIVDKMLARDPDERYESGEDIRADLAEILYGGNPRFSPLTLSEFLERQEALPPASVDLPRLLIPERDRDGESQVTTEEATEDAARGATAEPDPCDDRESHKKPIETELDITDRPTLIGQPGETEGDDRPTMLREPDIHRPRRLTLMQRVQESELWQVVRPASRGALFLMFGLMLLSGIFGAFVFALWGRDAGEQTSTQSSAVAEPGEAAELAKLDLSTVPAGAEILIGGTTTGSRTPAMLDLPAAMTSLELRKEGYRPKSVVVELAAGRRKVMKLDLERAEVAVWVRVEPPDTVVLDFPELHKRYLLRAGERVRVDGLQVGTEVMVHVRPEHGSASTRRFIPGASEDQEIVLRLAGDE